MATETETKTERGSEMGWKEIASPTAKQLRECYIPRSEKNGWKYWERKQGIKLIRCRQDRWQVYVPLAKSFEQ